jgi:hypothetical protein
MKLKKEQDLEIITYLQGTNYPIKWLTEWLTDLLLG